MDSLRHSGKWGACMYVWHWEVWDHCACDTVNRALSHSLTNATALKKHICRSYLKKYRAWGGSACLYLCVRKSVIPWASVMYIETWNPALSMDTCVHSSRMCVYLCTPRCVSVCTLAMCLGKLCWVKERVNRASARHFLY